MIKLDVKISLIVILLACVVFSSGFEPANCFDYYEFQNGILFDNLHVDKASYAAGDEVIVSYNLISKMKAPIVEGLVRVQIFYDHPTQGEQMLDEFYAARNINLFENDMLPEEHKWTLPKDAKPGEYVVKTYFIVDETFNLAGISFLPYGPPGVPGAQTKFTVAGAGGSMIYFDKGKVFINDRQYIFGQYSTVFEPGPVTLNTELINEGAERDITVNIEIYKWDDAVEENLISGYTSKKTYHLAANDRQTILYDLPQLDADSYLIRLEAISGEDKTIMKLRLPVSGVKGRFQYLGLADFPATSKENTLFFCFSNSADYTSSVNGKIKVEVLDKDDNIIFEEISDDIFVTSAPTGAIVNFTPDNEYYYLKLRAMLMDDQGNIMDEKEIVYDYSAFANINKNFVIELDKDRYRDGEEVKYTVHYKDDYDNPLSGEVLIYLLDQRGKIIKMTEPRQMTGALSGVIKLPVTEETITGQATGSGESSYTIKAIEVKDRLVAYGSVMLGGLGLTGWTLWVGVGILIIIVVAGLYHVYNQRKWKRLEKKFSHVYSFRRATIIIFSLLLVIAILNSAVVMNAGGTCGGQIAPFQVGCISNRAFRCVPGPFNSNKLELVDDCTEKDMRCINGECIGSFETLCHDQPVIDPAALAKVGISIPFYMQTTTHKQVPAHIGLNIYFNPVLVARNYVLKSGDDVCLEDDINLEQNAFAGEWFQKGGPTDSPPIVWVDDINAIKEQVGDPDFKPHTYLTFFGVRYEREMYKSTADATVFCSRNCDISPSDSLSSNGNNTFKAVTDGLVSIDMDCKIDCIMYIEPASPDEVYITNRDKLPQFEPGFVDLIFENKGIKDIAFSMDLNAVGIQKPPKLDVLSKQYDEDTGTMILKIANTGDIGMTIDEISFNHPYKIISSPYTLAGGEQADLLVQMGNEESILMTARYRSDKLGCLDKKEFEDRIIIGRPPCPAGSACTAGNGCSGTCSDNQIDCETQLKMCSDGVCRESCESGLDVRVIDNIPHFYLGDYIPLVVLLGESTCSGDCSLRYAVDDRNWVTIDWSERASAMLGTDILKCGRHTITFEISSGVAQQTDEVEFYVDC